MTASVDPVEVRWGLPPPHRRRVAEMCYEAFRPKFEPILRSRQHGIAILERDLNPDLIAVAECEERLAGMVGLEYGGRYFFNPRVSTFAHEFGRVRGILRLALFWPFARHRGAGDPTVGAIAVVASMRGRGVGVMCPGLT